MLDRSAEMCYTDSVKSVGVDDGKVPPVPIPNTEVKLIHAEDTQMVTSRENRAAPALIIYTIFLNSSVGRAHDC